ncbi:hypothetical protein [Deinococcus xianganensis]|uniref:Uncharacterized protein n=1 Tax=Deinococcus xianganensis TaxID=1507289 RepID=A0A6I4YNV7_9DEIO|nr:hypothetical protein [Deinococcus xianganensis]MXV21781.1 hypothetical protein [Deinococcus xianganensis]
MSALVTLTALLAATSTEWCSAQVYRSYSLGVSYRAAVIPDQACLDRGGVLRLRKVSTMSLKPFQPQKPNGSEQYGGLWGWNVTARGSQLPTSELWTLYSWQWQRWDGRRWVVAR